MTSPPEFLTVPELADLLRIKERKVYDLAASGLVPCTRATGKLLFPESEIRAWISSNQTGAKVSRPFVFLGSHDPLLEWALRQSQCGLATFFDGSSDGLSRFAADEGVATGLHVPGEGGWNTAAVKERCGHKDAVLISWATRSRGIVSKPGRLAAGAQLKDLAGMKIASRQVASGTSVLFDNLTKEQGLEYVSVGPYHSEQDAALSVLEGQADACFGLEAMARQFALSFTPLIDEQFDLLVDRAAYFEGPFQTFLAFCRSDEFRDRAGTQPGYTIDTLGEVRWNA